MKSNLDKEALLDILRDIAERAKKRYAAIVAREGVRIDQFKNEAPGLVGQEPNTP